MVKKFGLSRMNKPIRLVNVPPSTVQIHSPISTQVLKESGVPVSNEALTAGHQRRVAALQAARAGGRACGSCGKKR